MSTATLKSRIDKLINDIGGLHRPGPVDIKNRLVAFSHLAEALESGQSAVESEQKITAMEATIKDLEAKFSGAGVQVEKLQSALEAARDEIRRIQADEDENEPVSSAEAGILYALDKFGIVPRVAFG